MKSTGYRSRIYKNYMSVGQKPLAPATVKELMPRAPILRKIIRAFFPPNHDANILDLGCGHGAFIYFIREAGYVNVTGIDGSPEQVDEARRHGIEGVVQGDLMDTLGAKSDSSQDVIISFDVLEHFTKDELLIIVDEVFRVLRKGGCWIIHTANGEAPFIGRIRYGDFTHEMAFTRESITQLLKSSGFTEVICQEDTPIPHGIKSGIRWVLWKFIRAGLRFYLAVETGAGEAESIFSQNFLAVAAK